MGGPKRGLQIRRMLVAIAAGVGAALATPMTGFASLSASYAVGTISNLTTSCAGQNAEVEQAVDPAIGYIYEEWMGCSGIAFARSADSGRTFSDPVSVPGAVGSNLNSWDPALAVAPDGTVYAAFMVAHSSQWYPVVAASFDHGATFSQVSSLLPPDAKNWGDRDFIAVAPDGTVYLTWDYGPSVSQLTLVCARIGSCSFATGELNAVVESSTDGGRTFGPMTAISPGFPAGGADSAPLLVEPDGQIDVVYQGYSYRNRRRLVLGHAYTYFTSSTDGGRTWSRPVRLAPQAGTMNNTEWWIDGDITRDAGGNLYVTWDTQARTAHGRHDVGWLAYSTDHGATWSAPVQVPRDRADAAHIVEATGGPAGIAYVGWQSDSSPRGWAVYLRTFSIAGGWESGPVRISRSFGLSGVWPGDTFGLSTLGPGELVVSWGTSRAGRGHSRIDATTVGVG